MYVLRFYVTNNEDLSTRDESLCTYVVLVIQTTAHATADYAFWEDFTISDFTALFFFLYGVRYCSSNVVLRTCAYYPLERSSTYLYVLLNCSCHNIVSEDFDKASMIAGGFVFSCLSLSRVTCSCC
jgi:hypothetical protein